MPTLNDFIKDTQTLGYADRHVRAFSGRSTVGRIPGSVTGLERFFCPPFAAGELAMTIDVEITSHGLTLYDRALMGHEIPQQLLLQAERWHPSYIWRKGTFHRHTDKGLASLTVETWPALALPPVNENGGGWLEAGDIRFHPKTKTVVFPAKLLLGGIVFVDLVAISGAWLPMVAVGLVLFSLILFLQRNIPAT